MLREMICIMCPSGCSLTIETANDSITEISGNLCPKGREYAYQEITNPVRNIATSVLVTGGDLPLVSVRLNKPVGKNKIFAVMNEIKKIVLAAPVEIGDIIIADVCGTGSDVIATKNISKGAV